MTQSPAASDLAADAQPLALIIGATGNFGAHAAAALLHHGWRLRALARDPAAARAKSGPNMPIDWVKGDAMNAADVIAAAEGAQVIVHAANPPGYKNWRGLAVPMLRAAIAGARASGARLVLPGNVYNYAPDAGPRIAEDAPHAPATRKGAIRVEMEAMLRAAVAEGGMTALVLRAGDFFGPAAASSSLSWLVSHGRGRVKAIYMPGPHEVGHCFAYLPDLAETLARVLDRRAELAPYETFHFAGHWLERADDLAASARRVTGDPKVKTAPFPVAVVYALSPVNETFRELIEMMYLWRKPIGLDEGRLRAFLGEVPHTPLDVALRESLADMGLAVAAAPAAGLKLAA